MRKTIPATRRVLGDSHEFTLGMRRLYASALIRDPDATLDDLHEAVTTLDDADRIARRVFGDAHPLTSAFGRSLQNARDKLSARETASGSP